VPIGGWYGNGRKAGWVSPFLLAAWDPETETLATVCRCMSGFTDAFYAEVRNETRAYQMTCCCVHQHAGPSAHHMPGAAVSDSHLPLECLR
jgi:ATP-dependent DNA ligase